MSVFKFPGDGNIVFQCQISLCDMENDDACKDMIVSSFLNLIRLFSNFKKAKVVSFFFIFRIGIHLIHSNLLHCFLFVSFDIISLKPPRCSHNSTLRLKRETEITIKPGFVMTFDVETRTLNVLENESTRPAIPIKYCDIRM